MASDEIEPQSKNLSYFFAGCHEVASVCLVSIIMKNVSTESLGDKKEKNVWLVEL